MENRHEHGCSTAKVSGLHRKLITPKRHAPVLFCSNRVYKNLGHFEGSGVIPMEVSLMKDGALPLNGRKDRGRIYVDDPGKRVHAGAKIIEAVTAFGERSRRGQLFGIEVVLQLIRDHDKADAACGQEITQMSEVADNLIEISVG